MKFPSQNRLPTVFRGGRHAVVQIFQKVPPSSAMVIRAATAKVGIPAKGARLVSLLRGCEQASGQLGFGQKCSRLLTLRLVEQMGFPKTYFDNLGGLGGFSKTGL